MADYLLVTTEPLAGDSLRAVLRELRRGGANVPPRVRVVSPALAESAVKHQLGDIDEAIGPARGRLEDTIRGLRGAAVEATGEVGDSDPVMAIGDELRKLPADRILLVSHADDKEAAYAEKELLERVRREFEPPVTEVRVGRGGAEVAERRSAPGGIERAQEGRRLSPNLPPVRTRDGLGLLVAVLGTIALFLIAASCEPSGETLAVDRCGVALLIAGGFFLINLAHAGGILLMESVGYRGPFERFMARLSLIGTPLAIVAVTVLVSL